MDKCIKELKEIIDDKLITPSERYNKLIKYINTMYKYYIDNEENSDEEEE